MALILSLLQWIPGLSLIPVITKAISSFLEIATPILKAIAEAFVYYLKALWDGFRDMIDNVNSIIFVLTVCLLAGLYVHTKEVENCAESIAAHQKKTERTVTKRPSSPVRTVSPFEQFFEGIFGR